MQCKFLDELLRFFLQRGSDYTNILDINTSEALLTMLITRWDLVSFVWGNTAAWIIFNYVFYSTYNFLSTGKTISLRIIGTEVCSDITGIVSKPKMLLCKRRLSQVFLFEVTFTSI